jgi:hypothetical protein
MRRIKGILVVLLIFLCGMFVGGTIGSSAALVDVANRIIRGGPANIRKVLVQRAKNEFKIDEDQSHQVWQILNETGVELRDAVKPVRPQLDAVLERSTNRLRAILKPEQQQRFDTFAKEARLRWQMTAATPPASAGETEPPADR